MIPVLFHEDQLLHKPVYEWRFGERIEHPETTYRAESILSAIKAHPEIFRLIKPQKFPHQLISETHSKELKIVYQTAMTLRADETFYPSVFPKRDVTKPDPTKIPHSGYYCFDAGTPLTAYTYSAAAWSAACANEAAKLVEEGQSRVAYALSRPPGHHASKSMFGGYCYFNNVAIAAKRLRKKGKVCILDIDFHHGNGTQSIFYRDDKVMVLNIHGDPDAFYPYFVGTASEKGAGLGLGFNHNFPLGAGIEVEQYINVLQSDVIPLIKGFSPDFLLVSAGFDTYVSDPVGNFSLETNDYRYIAKLLYQLDLPTVIVQEGGYEARSLGDNVVSFLLGFRAI